MSEYELSDHSDNETTDGQYEETDIVRPMSFNEYCKWVRWGGDSADTPSDYSIITRVVEYDDRLSELRADYVRTTRATKIEFM